jgi:hypothetical protein
MLPYTQSKDSLQNDEENLHLLEQGNEKQSGRMVCPETLELLYMVLPGWVNDQATPST